MFSVQCSVLRTRVQGSRFRVQFSVFSVEHQGSGLRVRGSGFRVQDNEFRCQGSGFRVQGSGFRVQGAGCRVHTFPSVLSPTNAGPVPPRSLASAREPVERDLRGLFLRSKVPL